MRVFLRGLLRDLVELRRPVTAASIVTLVTSLVEPFGMDAGPWAPRMLAVLVGVGVITAWLESRVRG